MCHVVCKQKQNLMYAKNTWMPYWFSKRLQHALGQFLYTVFYAISSLNSLLTFFVVRTQPCKFCRGWWWIENVLQLWFTIIKTSKAWNGILLNKYIKQFHTAYCSTHCILRSSVLGGSEYSQCVFTHFQLAGCQHECLRVSCWLSCLFYACYPQSLIR